MSILNYLIMLLEYTKDYMPPSVKWRERRIWHRTKSGDMHFIKIKSLPPEEQLKYKPVDLINKEKRIMKLKKSDEPDIKIKSLDKLDISNSQMFNFYYGVKDPNKYNEFKEGELVKATLDPEKAIDLEDDENLYIVYAQHVPIDAVKEYMDEEGEWRKIKIDDKNEKAEFIKFSENDYFKLDLYNYKDIIKLELQNDKDEYNKDNEIDKNDEIDKDNEIDKNDEINKDKDSKIDENIKELKNYEMYLINKKCEFLIENNIFKLIKEDTVDPEIKRIAKKIADKLGLIYNGFIDFSNVEVDEKMKKYVNQAYYTDPETKSTISVNIVKDFLTSLKYVWERLKELRNKYKIKEPLLPAELR